MTKVKIIKTSLDIFSLVLVCGLSLFFFLLCYTRSEGSLLLIYPYTICPHLPTNSHNTKHIRFACWSGQIGLNRSSHILILHRRLRTKICCLLPNSVNITTEEEKKNKKKEWNLNSSGFDYNLCLNTNRSGWQSCSWKFSLAPLYSKNLKHKSW